MGKVLLGYDEGMAEEKLKRHLKSLRSEDAGVKVLALMQLQSTSMEELEGSPGFEELLADLLSLKEANDRDVRFLSAKVIGRLQKFFQAGDGPSNPYYGLNEEQSLSRLENEGDPVVLARVLQHLPKPTEGRHWKVLAHLLQHEDERVRANAVEFFDRHWEGPLERALSPLIEDGSNRVRANALVALGKRQIEIVEEPLLAMLADHSLAMRESGIWCLQNLPGREVFLPWVKTALLESYVPIASRAVELVPRYHEKDVLETMQELFFETSSKALKQKIYAVWKQSGLPADRKAEIEEELRSQQYHRIGVELFDELSGMEIYDPRLRAHHFLIVRHKDEMRVLLASDASRDPSRSHLMRAASKGLKHAYIAMGRTAFDLHHNEDYFFEQCQKAEKKISTFLNSLPNT